MKLDKNAMLLYAVTNRAWTGEKTLYEQVEDALRGGATCIQLREKEMPDEDFLEEAIIIKALCHKYQVPFIVNDNVGVAINCGADGIHVGQHDMNAEDIRRKIGEDMILGVSVQTVDQALLAEKSGANYLGAGAVFTTATKADADYLGRETLAEICRAVSIPVVAIGGITKTNMAELAGTGIDGVALVSAIFASDDIRNECAELTTLARMLVKV